ncbi:DUF2809 domain-containing protein [Microbacterium sp. NPDC090225]|uniref:ribosomal maturation YjgA family protein n=1 Tax=Microbacterium sp. NPDC090225 TaxID=3364207 RepID=UPI00381DB5CF
MAPVIASSRPERNRRAAAAASAAVVIGAGFLVHGTVEGPAGDIAGDALYAVLVYGILVFCFPRARIGAVGASATFFCAAIEFAQLTGIPRALAEVFPPSRLVLGSGFDPRDLVVYLCAVIATASIDLAVRSARTPHPENTEGALPEESAF